MGRKLRHVLIFLLIILKEPSMPNQITTINSDTFANLPQLQWLSLSYNQITTIPSGIFVNLHQLQKLFLSYNQITTIPSGTFVNLPQLQELWLNDNQITTIPSVVIILIGTFLAVIWKMRRARKPPLGRNPGVVVGSNTNAAASVMASGHDQAGQGQSQAVTASTTNTTATVMASDDDRQYEGIDNPRVKTRQGQSQAITESNTNTTATMASDHDQIGQGQSPANIQSLKVGNLSHDEVLADLQPNPMYLYVKLTPKDDASTEIAKSNDQTGQGQPQAETESLDVRNLSYGTGQTASQQNSVYKVVTQSQTITNTIATVMASGDVQTGQGQYQAITESLDARNLSYGTVPTASQLNSVYKTATVMTSGQDQTVRGQSQAITESNTSTTATEMTSDHYYQYEDIENNLLKTGQGQSQAITESNTSTTATVMTSDHYYQYEDIENNLLKTGQGQSQIH
ncbi:Bax inhibitor 1 [Branchiostoma belcheri]|nr:Bax inhibitor 1 [Branchiostoma belcheri]